MTSGDSVSQRSVRKSSPESVKRNLRAGDLFDDFVQKPASVLREVCEYVLSLNQKTSLTHFTVCKAFFYVITIIFPA